jgi:hypothetical protein
MAQLRNHVDMRNVVIAVLLGVLGCGVDTRNIGTDPDPDGGAGGAGTGTGGAGASGTGGAPGGGIGSPPIYPADAVLCDDWPICPEGILAPMNQSARSNVRCGIGFGCSICRDNRNGQCAEFVGKCRALNTLTSDGRIVAGDPARPSDCMALAEQPAEPTYYRCVGGSLINVVCADGEWPQ